MEFFSNPVRLFRSALLLGTLEYTIGSKVFSTENLTKESYGKRLDVSRNYGDASIQIIDFLTPLCICIYYCLFAGFYVFGKRTMAIDFDIKLQ